MGLAHGAACPHGDETKIAPEDGRKAVQPGRRTDRSAHHGPSVQLLGFTVTVVPVAGMTPRSTAKVQLVEVVIAPGAAAVQSRLAN